MPVPLIVTNPEAAPVSAAANQELQTEGPFARLKQQGPAAASLAPGSDAAPSSTSISATSQIPTIIANAGTGSAIRVQGLTFAYPGLDGQPVPGQPPLISDLDLDLPPGSRCLLIGANGAGKTTLLKILGGKHMVPEQQVAVLGRPPFHATELTSSGALSYCGGNWTRDIAFAGYSIPLTGDFPAGKMIDSVPGVDPARKRRLVEALDIDLGWRMHIVSDGQRRRVQICVSLLKPFKVLLLDEITVDLDVLGRAELMRFLREECERRGATIVYATHIFDGLESWPTHVAFMSAGRMQLLKRAEDVPELQQGRLLDLVVRLLQEEKQQQPKRPLVWSWDESSEGKVDSYSMVFNNGWTPGTLNSSNKLSTNSVMRM